MDASSLRKEYTSAGLDKADVDPDPLVQFHEWFEKVIDADLHEPNAMILATATAEGKPSARTVLLKGYDERGFIFYSNYEGRKAKEIDANPTCALLFYWGELERQVRIEAVRVASPAKSPTPTSRAVREEAGSGRGLPSRAALSRTGSILEERVGHSRRSTRGVRSHAPFRVRYRVEPDTIEFWQGRENRRDRIVYHRSGRGWKIVRLQRRGVRPPACC